MEHLPATTLFERDPVDSLEATQWIRERIESGRRSAVEIAVLIAHVRDVYYVDDASGWLAWAQQEFGYQRRFCFECLKGGRLLTAVHHDALARCEPFKLEMLANIPESQLPALLKQWDPSTATREEVRRKVAMWAGSDDDPVECTRCTQEFIPPKDSEDDVCPACKKAEKERRKAAGGSVDPIARVEKMLLELVAMMDSDTATVKQALDGSLGIRAGVKLIVATLQREADVKAWDEGMFGSAAAMIEALRGQLSQVASDRGITRAQLTAVTKTFLPTENA